MFQIIIITVILIVLYLANKSERSVPQKINETVYIKPQKNILNIVFLMPPPPHMQVHRRNVTRMRKENTGKYSLK